MIYPHLNKSKVKSQYYFRTSSLSSEHCGIAEDCSRCTDNCILSTKVHQVKQLCSPFLHSFTCGALGIKTQFPLINLIWVSLTLHKLIGHKYVTYFPLNQITGRYPFVVLLLLFLSNFVSLLVSILFHVPCKNSQTGKVHVRSDRISKDN